MASRLLEAADRDHAPARDADAAKPLTHPVERALVLVAGVSVGLWTAMDGSPAGRILRAVVAVTVAAVAAQRLPSSSSRRGWLLIAVGLFTTSVGLGIAPAHLAKEGMTVESAAALVALLDGTALLVAGTRDVTASRHGAGRLLSVAGTAVTIAVALYLVVPGTAAVNVPATTHSRTPAAFGLPYEDVWFDTDDGVRLHGWYLPADNGAAIVVRHGSGSTAASALDQAAVLNRHGFGALVTDARGHGRSEGRAMDFGWYGDLDTRAAVAFLAARPEIRSGAIGVLGLSMGGEEALGAGDAEPRLRAIVAEGATGRTTADHDWFSDAFGLRGWIQEQLEWAQSTFTDALTPATKPTPLADAVAVGPPTLLIAAGTVADEIEVASRLAAVNPDDVDTWVVPDATHTGGLRADPDGWEQRVVGFFEATLLG